MSAAAARSRQTNIRPVEAQGLRERNWLGLPGQKLFLAPFLNPFSDRHRVEQAEAERATRRERERVRELERREAERSARLEAERRALADIEADEGELPPDAGAAEVRRRRRRQNAAVEAAASRVRVPQLDPISAEEWIAMQQNTQEPVRMPVMADYLPPPPGYRTNVVLPRCEPFDDEEVLCHLCLVAYGNARFSCCRKVACWPCGKRSLQPHHSDERDGRCPWCNSMAATLNPNLDAIDDEKYPGLAAVAVLEQDMAEEEHGPVREPTPEPEPADGVSVDDEGNHTSDDESAAADDDLSDFVVSDDDEESAQETDSEEEVHEQESLMDQTFSAFGRDVHMVERAENRRRGTARRRSAAAVPRQRRRRNRPGD